MLHNLKVTELKAEAADRMSEWLKSQFIQKYNMSVSEFIKLKLVLWHIIISQIKVFKNNLKKIDMTLKNK